MSIHWIEKVKNDLSQVPDDQLLLARAELSGDVVSIESNLGDRNKCHPDGVRMNRDAWNSWKQNTKRALKYKLDALIKVKAEQKRRDSAGQEAKSVLKDLLAAGAVPESLLQAANLAVGK